MSSRKITSNVQSLPEQFWNWMNDEERIKRQDAERKARYANDSSGTDNPFKSADLAAPMESAPSAPVDPIFEAPMSRPSDSNMSPMEFSPKMSLKDELVDRSIDSTRLQSPEAKMMMSSADDPSQIINPGKLESPDARRMVIEDALKKKFEAPQMNNSQFPDDSMVADAIRQGGKDKLVAMLGSGGADLIKGATGFQADASPYNAMFAGAGNTEKTVRDYLSQKYDREAKKKAYELQLEELKSKNKYQKANLDLQKEQNEIARAKAEAELKNSGNKIPDAIKPAADKMSEKIINKASALNQLDSMVAEMKAAKDVSSQIAVGERMLKLLNSLEGSDAVGADEAKRLANKLEFAWGNLTNKYPTRVGRDIEGFIKDAETQSRAGKAALEKDKAVWGGLTGKSLPVDTQKNGSGKMVTIKNDETGETKTVSEEEARALGAL